MTGITMRPILFSLNQVADLCEVKPQVLRNWIANGAIKPAYQDTTGRGRPHSFTAQQVLGLTFGVGLMNTQGARPHYISQLVEEWGAMTDEQLKHWLSLEREDLADERTEESWAAFVHQQSIIHPPKPEPAPDPVVSEIHRRWKKVDTAILAKLGLERSRIAGAKESKSKA